MRGAAGDGDEESRRQDDAWPCDSGKGLAVRTKDKFDGHVPRATAEAIEGRGLVALVAWSPEEASRVQVDNVISWVASRSGEVRG